MTLRVTISIVPFGEEEKERAIRTINISNLGKAYDDMRVDNPYRYGIEVDRYKTDEYDAFVFHYREDGPEILVSNVISTLKRERKL